MWYIITRFVRSRDLGQVTAYVDGKDDGAFLLTLDNTDGPVQELLQQARASSWDDRPRPTSPCRPTGTAGCERTPPSAG